MLACHSKFKNTFLTKTLGLVLVLGIQAVAAAEEWPEDDSLFNASDYRYPIAKEFDKDRNNKLDDAEQAALMKELLVLYDVNKNGILDPVEEKAAKGLENRTFSRFQGWWRFDKNQDHKLDCQEKQAMLALLIPMYDKNRNGLLDPDEIDEMITAKSWQ